MDGPVQADEQLSCFLFHSNDFKTSTGKPNYSAYMPASNGRKSVYRTQGLAAAAIHGLGSTYVEPHRAPFKLKGHADQIAGNVFAVGLTVDPDRAPHPRHANIQGWTDRAANRNKAKKIADTATVTYYG